jgi:hypothetical protein
MQRQGWIHDGEGYYMDDRASSYQTSLVAKMLTLFDAANLAGIRGM